MLGSHSRMFATPESQFKIELLPLFNAKSSANDIQDALNNHFRFRIWDFKPAQKIDFTSIPGMMQSIVSQYAAMAGRNSFDFWVDHTPSNLRYASLLKELYPHCYFIHIIRDGRAVYASQRKVDFGSNDPFFAALKWSEELASGLACETAFAERTLRIHYEHLVAEPEQECKKICAFAGLEFEPSMLLGKGFHVPVYTRHQHDLVGKQPDVSRIDSWKNELSEQDVYFFESMTYDLLPMLGYEKVNQGWLKKPGEITQALVIIGGALKYMTVNKLKWKKRIRKNG